MIEHASHDALDPYRHERDEDPVEGRLRRCSHRIARHVVTRIQLTRGRRDPLVERAEVTPEGIVRLLRPDLAELRTLSELNDQGFIEVAAALARNRIARPRSREQGASEL